MLLEIHYSFLRAAIQKNISHKSIILPTTRTTKTAATRSNIFMPVEKLNFNVGYIKNKNLYCRVFSMKYRIPMHKMNSKSISLQLCWRLATEFRNQIFSEENDNHKPTVVTEYENKHIQVHFHIVVKHSQTQFQNHPTTTFETA
jgi:hypothetical protein